MSQKLKIVYRLYANSNYNIKFEVYLVKYNN